MKLSDLSNLSVKPPTSIGGRRMSFSICTLTLCLGILIGTGAGVGMKTPRVSSCTSSPPTFIPTTAQLRTTWHLTIPVTGYHRQPKNGFLIYRDSSQFYFESIERGSTDDHKNPVAIHPAQPPPFESPGALVYLWSRMVYDVELKVTTISNPGYEFRSGCKSFNISYF